MDPASPSQQDTWRNNIYILSTTRVLMVIGLTFVVRSFYQLYQWTRSTDSTVRSAADTIEIDLEALPPGALNDGAMSSSGAVDGINDIVEVTTPQSTYSPRGRSSL